MKFLGAVGAYVLIALILAWGILLAVKGSYWLLAAAFLTYAVAFAKIGCLPSSDH